MRLRVLSLQPPWLKTFLSDIHIGPEQTVAVFCFENISLVQFDKIPLSPAQQKKINTREHQFYASYETQLIFNLLHPSFQTQRWNFYWAISTPRSFQGKKESLKRKIFYRICYIVKIASNQRQVVSSLLQSEASSGFLIQYTHGNYKTSFHS